MSRIATLAAAVLMLAAPALATEAALAPFVDRVWVAAEPEDGRPGDKRIFLSDGTLVQDSCFETYRLSRWEPMGATTVRWDEDGAEIVAELTGDETELELVLHLGHGDTVEQRFVPAEVPFVCPDLPR